jgi:hypothetical protein
LLSNHSNLQGRRISAAPTITQALLCKQTSLNHASPQASLESSKVLRQSPDITHKPIFMARLSPANYMNMKSSPDKQYLPFLNSFGQILVSSTQLVLHDQAFTCKTSFEWKLEDHLMSRVCVFPDTGLDNFLDLVAQSPEIQHNQASSHNPSFFKRSFQTPAGSMSAAPSDHFKQSLDLVQA